MLIHFLNFEKNIDMAQNSTEITEIAFSELKAENKQLVAENLGKKVFWSKFQKVLTHHLGTFQGPLDGEGVDVGTLKTFLGYTLACRPIV